MQVPIEKVSDQWSLIVLWIPRAGASALHLGLNHLKPSQTSRTTHYSIEVSRHFWAWACQTHKNSITSTCYTWTTLYPSTATPESPESSQIKGLAQLRHATEHGTATKMATGAATCDKSLAEVFCDVQQKETPLLPLSTAEAIAGLKGVRRAKYLRRETKSGDSELRSL